MVPFSTLTVTHTCRFVSPSLRSSPRHVAFHSNAWFSGRYFCVFSHWFAHAPVLLGTQFSRLDAVPRHGSLPALPNGTFSILPFCNLRTPFLVWFVELFLLALNITVHLGTLLPSFAAMLPQFSDSLGAFQHVADFVQHGHTHRLRARFTFLPFCRTAFFVSLFVASFL